MEKFTPLATNFTLPPGLTGWTNFTSACHPIINIAKDNCTVGRDIPNEDKEDHEQKLQVQNLQAPSSLTKLQHFDATKVTTTKVTTRKPAGPLLSCPRQGTGGCCRGSAEK